VAARPNSIYVTDDDRQISYQEVMERGAIIQLLLRENGVLPGDVVSLLLPNWWETVVAMHAVWGLGAVVNPVSPINRGRDLQTIFGLARPKLVLAPNTYRGIEYRDMVVEALTAAGSPASVATVRDPVDATGAVARSHPGFEAIDQDPDDIAMLMYTSGTTGRPKGVLHSHRTLLYESQSIAETFGLHGDSIFMPSPLTHITGLCYGVIMPVLIEGSVVLMDRWDAANAVELIEHNACTATVSATPFLRGLSDRYEIRGMPSSLRVFVCGGADIPEALVAAAEKSMGTRVSRTYGSTEMPTLSVVRLDDLGETRFSTEGRIIGEARARLTGAVDGLGELEVHGPELFVGYLDETENESAFAPDGWFRTGDLARIESDGTIVIAGRLKDLIVRGGENISAKEVEDLLLTHPTIDDVSIVGIPDDVMGERACAVVVSRDEKLSLADLTAHLDESGIAKQKYPELLFLVAELPRTTSGKVQKFQLRAEAVAAIGEGRVEKRK
jgi:cyclohexanecarboxylate-CoA ligase